MRNEISLYTPPTVRAEHGRSPLFVSRRECAVLLFPTSSVKGAVAAMHRWIEGDEQLRKALDKMGYRPRTKWLSRRVVEVLRRFI